MKKLLVVLLSLGLIVAISTAASAAMDVRFSGSYYVSGIYDNNSNLTDNSNTQVPRNAWYQQMRVQTDFMIAEGLKVTTRFDALEKIWGQTNFRNGGMASPAALEDKTNSRTQSPSTVAGASDNGQYIQENIEFEQAYLTFMTKIGQFAVGYQPADAWGTVFGNSTASRPRIVYSTQFGPMTILGVYEKVFESDSAPYWGGALAAPSNRMEDADTYAIGAIYNAKGIEAGLLVKNYADNRSKQVAGRGFTTNLYLISPYAKMTFGPVYLEGEINYWAGKACQFDGIAGAQDIDMAAWSAYGLAKVNIGPAYVGGLVGWIQGDGDDATKITNNYSQGGGYDWKPMLYFNNIDTASYLPATNLPGQAIGPTKDTYRTDPKGYIVYSLIGGYNATPKLLFEGALSYTAFDKDTAWGAFAARTAGTQVTIADKKIGTELDIKATYKIFDNLTYMVGAGYMWAGDAWKSAVSNPTVGNDYILLNQLKVTF